MAAPPRQGTVQARVEERTAGFGLAVAQFSHRFRGVGPVAGDDNAFDRRTHQIVQRGIGDIHAFPAGRRHDPSQGDAAGIGQADAGLLLFVGKDVQGRCPHPGV
ncbi:hypothetical protein G6F59_017416 [Rhizopus arrhizus]|nr:hypothetical protein G6F59_017416 [Rhizopus arrhizus]